MSYLSELLMDARRRAQISGLPLTNQETEGIVQAGLSGAGERVLAAQRLLEERKRLEQEKLNQQRQYKSAKKATEAQETANKINTLGDAYTIDKAAGSPVTGAVKNAITAGSDALLKAGGSTYNTRGVIDKAGRTIGNWTNGLLGTAPMIGANAIPGVTSGTLMTQAANPAVSNMMAQIGAKPLMSVAGQAGGQLASQTGTQLAGQTAGNLAATGATQGATNAATGTWANIGSQLGSMVKPVGGVISYIAAADAARNIWGGDLERNYSDAGWSQKIARTPVVATSPGGLETIRSLMTGTLPMGFGSATEGEITNKLFGKDSKASKIINEPMNSLGKLEEKVVGKPLDKIFKAVGKIFCFAEGTPMQMEDGSFKNVEDIEIGDSMLEGGRVIGTGKVENNDLWDYKGVKLAGTHAVLEDGRWKRVSDSRYGKPVDQTEPVIVYPVCNENHIIISSGVVFSDYMETDHGTGVNDQFRLDFMNTQGEWNQYLSGKYYREAA